MDEEVKIKIGADASGVNTSIDEVDKKIGETQKKATALGSVVNGVFERIGHKITDIFSFENIKQFFLSSIKYAEKLESEMSDAEKAAKGIGETVGDIEKKFEASANKAKGAIGPPLLELKKMALSIFSSILEFVTSIFTAFEDRVIGAYQKLKKETIGLGEEATKLDNINSRTAEQELKLIDIKEQLSKRAKALGLDYEQLAASGKTYLQIAKEIAEKAKLNTQAELTTGLVRDIGNVAKFEQGIEQRRKIIEQQRAAGNEAEAKKQERYLLVDEASLDKLKAKIRRRNKQIDDVDKESKPESEEKSGGGRNRYEEARFLDSRLRLETIFQNRKWTIAKAIAETKEGEERTRRIAMANAEANQAVNYEINGLRQGYAQFIEDKRTAVEMALKAESDNARRMSLLLLEAQLEQAGKNEALIFDAKKSNAERLAKIEEAEEKKRRQADAQAVADTLAAAQSATAGFSQAAKAKDVGGFLGGLGGMSTGLSKISPELEALGPLGSAMGAIGGITSTIAGLFGKSDEERAREAAEAQRVREEQLKILELQASYQKSMLALQEAAAKLPFENLQRQLRLVDIESQQAALQGGDANAIENTRLSRRQAAIQQTLTSQSGAIAGGQLFGGVGSSPEQLIGFLSERGAESLAVQQFASLFGSLSSDVINRATGDAQIAQLASYRGKVPPALMAVFDDYVSKRNALLAEIDAERTRLRPIEVQLGTDWLNTQLSNAGNPRLANILSGSLSGVNALGSEISADTGIAENLLSTLEQSLSNEKAIKDNTKKTADNTSLQLEKQRENMFIDIAGGGLRGFGQFLSTGAQVNTGALSLSSSTSSAIAATAALKSWDERNHEELEKIVTINKYQAAVLLKIAENTQNLSTTGSLSQLVSMLNDINTRT